MYDLRATAREAWEAQEKVSRQLDRRTLRDLLRLKLEAPEEAIRFHYDVELGRWLGTIDGVDFFELANQLWLRGHDFQRDLHIKNLAHLHEILELLKEGEVAA
jgi:hypothetical protein